MRRFMPMYTKDANGALMVAPRRAHETVTIQRAHALAVVDLVAWPVSGDETRINAPVKESGQLWELKGVTG